MTDDVVIFDLDGVLLDSLPALKRAYAAFAAEQGFSPTAAEFERLNGPSLREIVADLRRTHALAASEAELLRAYLAHVQQHHAQAELAPDCVWLLEKLRAQSYRLALASSAPRALIERTLGRFQLGPYFEVVVGGDDVARAKPAPDIYRRVAELTPWASRYFVVEDSLPGVQAALAAGMRVVRVIDPDPDPSAKATAELEGTCGGASCLRDVLACIAAAAEGCRWIASARQIRVRISADPLPIAPELELAIAAFWQQQLAQRPALTDGHLLSYRTHRNQGGLLEVEVYVARFRHFVAALERPEWRVPIAPVGVSGVTCDTRGHVLAAERAAVTQYAGYLELVPSGSIDARHHQAETADAIAQLREEWSEETGLPEQRIQSVEPLGLIRAPDGLVYDLCFRIRLAGTLELADCAFSPEYVRPRLDPPLALRSATTLAPLVPVSRALLGIVA